MKFAHALRDAGREFYMKDGYNFDLTKEDALHAYNRHLSVICTYERMGLVAIPMRADSGPIGGDDTHEFWFLRIRVNPRWRSVTARSRI